LALKYNDLLNIPYKITLLNGDVSGMFKLCNDFHFVLMSENIRYIRPATVKKCK